MVGLFLLGLPLDDLRPAPPASAGCCAQQPAPAESEGPTSLESDPVESPCCPEGCTCSCCAVHSALLAVAERDVQEPLQLEGTARVPVSLATSTTLVFHPPRA